jgi:RNA polymerase sigma factor (sigma-70 family)
VKRVEDPEVAAAIVAGEPGGIAEAYDRYAMPLYAYCRSLLHEPADAADAVQDTFLIATSKLGGLRDPGKLRAWLYAVARNECFRRLRSGRAMSALDEAADMPAGSADVGRAVEQDELRDLVRGAISGLNPAERDVIELSLGHELAGDDLADALGVSRNHAHALLSRARSQLERSLGALVVARTGRQACPTLDAMLAGWDGQMTVLMRKRVSRHIEHCEICGERKRRELTPALFTGALPMVVLLPGFREQVLRICADRTPAGLAHRASVTARAGSFGPAGFPRPVGPPGASGWRHLLRHSRAMMASAATAAAAAGIGAVLFIGGGAPQGNLPGAGARGSAGPGSAGSTSGAPSARPGTRPTGGGSGLAPSAVSSGAETAPGPGVTPTATGGSGGSGGPGTSAAPSSTATAPQSSPAASSSAAQGTLTVSVDRLVLVEVSGLGTGTFTITAEGGPVSGYSISAASDLTVSPASGSLASGASVTITVSTKSLVSLDEQLTINPGGHAVTVVLNISL